MIRVNNPCQCRANANLVKLFVDDAKLELLLRVSVDPLDVVASPHLENILRLGFESLSGVSGGRWRHVGLGDGGLRPDGDVRFRQKLAQLLFAIGGLKRMHNKVLERKVSQANQSEQRKRSRVQILAGVKDSSTT